MEVVPMLDITLQQIVAFLTVAEYLSFTEAAKVMYISQPALSKIISRLERVSALTLFVRKSHGVELTREGEYLRGELDPLYNKILRRSRTRMLMSLAPKKLMHIASHTRHIQHESLHGEYRRLIDEYKINTPPSPSWKISSN
jgi:DNA-binding MarR family transcriptional regulator